MMTAYLGLILVSGAFLALGVGASALFTNQIAAFFVTLGLFIFLWWLVGFPAQYVTAGGDIFSYLDMKSHFYDSLNTGVINLSDLTYYLSLIALGLVHGDRSGRSAEVELMATKKTSAARYAFIGLIIAAVGCVATGLLAIVQGTVALKLFTPAKAETHPSMDRHQCGRPGAWSGRLRHS